MLPSAGQLRGAQPLATPTRCSSSQRQAKRLRPQAESRPVQVRALPHFGKNPLQPAATGQAAQEPYIGSDGRRKATLEEVWNQRSAAEAQSRDAQASTSDGRDEGRPLPWHLGFQGSERRLPTTEDMKARLLVRLVSQELGWTEERVSQGLQELQRLIPSSTEKLISMKPAIVAQLLQRPALEQLAARLVELKLAFPAARPARIFAAQPALALAEQPPPFQQAADRLRELLPRLNVDRLVEDFPVLLDVPAFQDMIGEAKRVLGEGADIQQIMATQPSMIFSLQRGRSLIAYDPPDNSDG